VDDPLVINPVPSKATVNPQIDSTITTPNQREKLNTSFNSFFEEIDSRGPPTIEDPPVAPKAQEEEPSKEVEPEPLKQEESKETPDKTDGKEPEAVPEAKEPEKPKEPEKKEVPKDDLDSLEAHPASSEESKGHFAKLKSAAKELRDKNKAWEKLAPTLQELGFTVSSNPEELSKVLSEASEKIRSLKNGAVAPEIMTELESLRGLARSVGVLQSEEFTRDYVKPIDDAYVDVIKEMSKYFDAPEEKVKEEFLDPLLSKFRPSQLPPEWWESQTLLMTKASAPIKRKIEQKIANVLLLQEKHDLKARELSENKLSYADWQKKSQEEGAKIYEANIRDQVQQEAKADPVVAAFMPQSLEGVTDPEKLSEIKKRNEKFPELEQRFQAVVRDFNSGPRAAAKRALEFIKVTEGLSEAKDKLATRDEEVATMVEKHEKELKALKEDNEKLREEVKAKRRISDITTKPSAGNGAAKATPEKKKAPVDGRRSLGDAFADWKL
jgi:hypothetical protein